MLLRAMYGASFILKSAHEFNRLVELGDYYRALPALSSGIRNALDISPAFIDAIHEVPHIIIENAVRLSHAVLYRECFIQAMGPMRSAKSEYIEAEALQNLIEHAEDKVTSIVFFAQFEMMTKYALVAKFSSDSSTTGKHSHNFPRMSSRQVISISSTAS